MRGKVHRDSLQFDPEIEKTGKKNRKQAKQRKQETSSSSKPHTEPIDANNYDIQLSLITLVEKTLFGVEDYEDPHDFMDRFLRISDTTKHHGVSDDAIRLRLFPFALTRKTLRWLDRQAPNSIRTWDDLAAKFFAKHFSREKYNKLVRVFYNRMTLDSRMVVNGAADRTIGRKTAAETLELIDYMARTENASMEVQPVKPKRGILQLGNNDASLAEHKVISQQLASLNAKLDKMQISTSKVNVFNCHHRIPKVTRGIRMAAKGNFQRRNQGGGLDYNSNNYLQPSPLPHNEPSELEKAMLQLSKTTNDHMQTTNAFINETRAYHKNQDASIRNLETQIGQLSRQLAERSQGTISSDTIVNSREHCNAITTKSEELEKEKAEVSTDKNEHIQEGKEKAKEQLPAVQKKQWDFSHFEKPQYPMKLKQHEQRKQFSKFLDIFKKLQINISFAEALEQMLSYTKFLKEILSKKRKLTEYEPVILTEECNVIL
ncbi:uncharacterized protein LOC133290836 [Gastrolobium bilobum]|uniref:uncharacterized protein LOC133290836 n=1 Tax=Gastrolobium bilobum TaxID=150636 RepID=UPI002AB0A2CB|nr:uncharacterized protein LOC133290836 [Gastrolobium bilobum]